MSSSSTDSPTLVRLVPMLAVQDLKRTIEFYTTGPGFGLCETVGDPPVGCDLQRDKVRLFFNQPTASTFPADWPGLVPASGHAPHAQAQGSIAARIPWSSVL